MGVIGRRPNGRDVTKGPERKKGKIFKKRKIFSGKKEGEIGVRVALGS